MEIAVVSLKCTAKEPGKNIGPNSCGVGEKKILIHTILSKQFMRFFIYAYVVLIVVYLPDFFFGNFLSGLIFPDSLNTLYRVILLPALAILTTAHMVCLGVLIARNGWTSVTQNLIVNIGGVAGFLYAGSIFLVLFYLRNAVI